MKTLKNVCLSLVMTLSTALIAFAQPKGPTVTVKGEAVDLWCYMEGATAAQQRKTAPRRARKPETLLESSM